MRSNLTTNQDWQIQRTTALMFPENSRFPKKRIHISPDDNHFMFTLSSGPLTVMIYRWEFIILHLVPGTTQPTLHGTSPCHLLHDSRVQRHIALITTDQVPIYSPGWRERHICVHISFFKVLVLNPLPFGCGPRPYHYIVQLYIGSCV